MVNPGVSRGTMIAETSFADVLANTRKCEAMSEFVMSHFRPLSTYSAPSRRAVVDRSAPVPLPGSVSANATDFSPVAASGRSSCLCSVLPISDSACAKELCTCTMARIPPWILANSERIGRYCAIDRPAPPYSLGTINPNAPHERSAGRTMS